MQAHRRQVWFALASGIGGALLVVLGRGVDSLDVGPSPLVLAAWGLLTGSVIGWVVASLPQRATFPLGFGTLLAAAGGVGLIVFLAGVLHQDLLDANPNALLQAALVCAGIGWVLGAAIGAALTAHAPRFTSGQAWLLRGAAIAAVPIGLVVAWLQGLSISTAHRPEPHLVPLQRTVVADAVLVCVTLLLVAGGRHARAAGSGEPQGAGSWFTRGTAWTGVALGCVVLIALLGSVLITPATAEDERQQIANQHTATSLASAAERYRDRRGSYPGDLGALLAAGGEIQPGSRVATLVADRDRLCFTVGTDTGSGEADGPYWYAVVEPRSYRSGTDPSGTGCAERHPPARLG